MRASPGGSTPVERGRWPRFSLGALTIEEPGRTTVVVRAVQSTQRKPRMRGFVIGALAAVAGAALFSGSKAQAQGLGGGLAVPSLVTEAACVTERIEGPRGVRMVRRCGPGIGMGGGRM